MYHISCKPEDRRPESRYWSIVDLGCDKDFYIYIVIKLKKLVLTLKKTPQKTPKKQKNTNILKQSRNRTFLRFECILALSILKCTGSVIKSFRSLNLFLNSIPFLKNVHELEVKTRSLGWVLTYWKLVTVEPNQDVIVSTSDMHRKAYKDPR